MKIITIILLSVFISCKSRREREVTWIISGADTIEIVGHYSFRHLGSPCGGWGHNDTITGRFVYKFNKCPTPDSALSIDVTNAVYPLNYKQYRDSGYVVDTLLYLQLDSFLKQQGIR